MTLESISGTGFNSRTARLVTYDKVLSPFIINNNLTIKVPVARLPKRYQGMFILSVLKITYTWK